MAQNFSENNLCGGTFIRKYRVSRRKGLHNDMLHTDVLSRIYFITFFKIDNHTLYKRCILFINFPLTNFFGLHVYYEYLEHFVTYPHRCLVLCLTGHFPIDDVIRLQFSRVGNLLLCATLRKKARQEKQTLAP